VGEKTMAEGKGFEPLLRFHVNTLSRRAPSTTRPPFRNFFGETLFALPFGTFGG
jgi:hypothetical protein